MVLTFYCYSSTPNRFPHLVLEALGNVDYDIREIDQPRKEQKSEWYLKINPEGKTPAITDGDFKLAQR